VAARGVASPGADVAQRDVGVGQLVTIGAGEDGSLERGEVGDPEQLVDVDRLGGQPGAHHVVARPHELDASTVQVRVQVAGTERERLPGLEHDEVEQQRGGDARIVRVHVVEQPTHLASGHEPAARRHASRPVRGRSGR
jgi:hypothetical protein